MKIVSAVVCRKYVLALLRDDRSRRGVGNERKCALAKERKLGWHFPRVVRGG